MRKDISNLDKNFVDTYSLPGLILHNIEEPEFKLYGAYRAQGEKDYKRLPHDIAMATNNVNVKELYTNTAGLRVRFKTDSKRIILRCVLPSIGGGTNLALSGSSCFDMYADGAYKTVFRPGINPAGSDSSDSTIEGGYTSGTVFNEKKLRDITINFPLYNDVSEVYIGLEGEAVLLPPDDYKYPVPVVYYGSSITQGGCASHPGNAYQGIISRRMDCDFINLGFSGGCRAEEVLGHYIAGLEMSVFVYDYDHNAPSIEHLEKTHYPFYKMIREKNPDLPIVMITAADKAWKNLPQWGKIIRASYDRAIAEGDKNVYFIDGKEMYEKVGFDYCTVDTTHPNDLGFLCMANSIEKVLREILERKA